MNNGDVVALCLAVRKNKFERLRAEIARCTKNLDQSQLEFLNAKEKQEEFTRNTPQLQNQLFGEIRGKPLSYLELDTYFSELAEISVANITLEETATNLKKNVDFAKNKLDKHLLKFREIRKKYEKMQKMEERVLSERRLQSIIEEDSNMDDIALTLSLSNTQKNM